MATASAADEPLMRRALELARLGGGLVEPNPLVGAVVAAAEAGGPGRIVGEGWHAAFGGPHAEVVALAAAGSAARGGTLAVTLEPCCHHGKTPPCTDAIIAAGIARVIVAARDPFPAVDGAGIDALRRAGIEVQVGLCEPEARRLTAAFRMLVEHGRPWLIAKWAMSLDGRVATAAGESRWISSAESRAIVHRLRGRVDGILCGIGTALADDPLLTARPAGPRRPLRIVLDTAARLPPTSRLASTAGEHPLLVATGPTAPADRISILRAAGCEVWQGQAPGGCDRIRELLSELGRRRLTNVLVEGGPTVLGSLFDAGLIDEVWTFVAPRMIGGAASPAPVGGAGVAMLAAAAAIEIDQVEQPGGDLFIRGTVRRPSETTSPADRGSRSASA